MSALWELYQQVNSSLSSFAKRNWGLLEGWDKSFAIESDVVSDDIVEAFIEDQQEFWGFSEFYFLSDNARSMTPNGVITELQTEDEWKDLMYQGTPVMMGGVKQTGQDVTLFAVPVKPNEYKGFEYSAISVSYTNEDMAKSLNVAAYANEAICFVAHNNGRVLLSTQKGGNVFENYLLYLKAVSDLERADLSRILDDWQSGTPRYRQLQNRRR